MNLQYAYAFCHLADITVKSALACLFPPQCLVCKEPSFRSVCFRCIPRDSVAHPSSRCVHCFELRTLDFDSVCDLCRISPLPFSSMRHLWLYDDVTKNLIHAMKYRPSLQLATLLGKVLADHMTSLWAIANWDMIIPMPSTAASLRQRNFNQCLTMANAFSRRLIRLGIGKVAVNYQALQYQKQPKSRQATLELKDRIRNVHHAFTAKQASLELVGRRILLLDDVITTGATSTVAATALLDAGAASIDVLALCRSQSWQEHRQEIQSGLCPKQ